MDQVKFAVFTDLHYDHIPDGDRRLQDFINNVRQAEVDFIVCLGDICYPTKENQVIIDELQRTEVPCYYAIGNHDTDRFPREQVMQFLHMKNNYYSFCKGKIKFIVLDACNIKQEDGSIPYYRRNYKNASDKYPYIPPEQLSWLERELNDSNEFYIIFSHHSLANEFAERGVTNRDEVRKIFEKANRMGKQVLMCMNGHDHGDAAFDIDGIWYYSLNAMSYIWHGQKEIYRYPEEIHQRYPYLKDVILYEEGLHAIVTLDGDGKIRIEGMDSKYQNVTPSEVGIHNNMWNGVSINPVVSSMKINAKLI